MFYAGGRPSSGRNRFARPKNVLYSCKDKCAGFVSSGQCDNPFVNLRFDLYAYLTIYKITGQPTVETHEYVSYSKVFAYTKRARFFFRFTRRIFVYAVDCVINIIRGSKKKYSKSIARCFCVSGSSNAH